IGIHRDPRLKRARSPFTFDFLPIVVVASTSRELRPFSQLQPDIGKNGKLARPAGQRAFIDIVARSRDRTGQQVAKIETVAETRLGLVAQTKNGRILSEGNLLVLVISPDNPAERPLILRSQPDFLNN